VYRSMHIVWCSHHQSDGVAGGLPAGVHKQTEDNENIHEYAVFDGFLAIAGKKQGHVLYRLQRCRCGTVEWLITTSLVT